MRPARRAASTPSRPLFKLQIRAPLEAADAIGALLIEEGAGGAVHEELPHEARIACFGEDRAELERLGDGVKSRLRAAGVSVTVRVTKAPRAAFAWRTDWMRDLGAVEVSGTLWLVPTTVEAPVTAAKIVRLEPAMAFGFGEHPTTRMAAAEVERAVIAGARRVLDFGTGSGVLAAVAAVSGAKSVIGVDVDEAAIAAAKGNAALNGVEGRCRFTRTGVGRLRAAYDLVVANVDRGTLLVEAERLARRLAPGGTLLLTGFLVEDARDLSRRYRALGLASAGKRDEAGWLLSRFRRPA